MFIKFLASLVFILNSTVILSQNVPEGATVKLRRLGPYVLGHNDQTVFAYIKRAYLPKSWHGRSPSDFSLVVKNKQGQEFYSKSFDYDGSDATKYEIDSINLLTQGKGLLILADDIPRMASEGIDGKILGIDKDGKVGELTRWIESTSSFIPIVIKSTLCIEVEEWNGYFSVLKYYVVHTNGKYDENEKPFPVEITPIRIDTNFAKICRKRYISENNDISIRLFSKPIRDTNSSKLIGITDNTSIQFIDAKEVNNEYWLHIIVNDQEGYISGDDNFRKVGLPEGD